MAYKLRLPSGRWKMSVLTFAYWNIRCLWVRWNKKCQTFTVLTVTLNAFVVIHYVQDLTTRCIVHSAATLSLLCCLSLSLSLPYPLSHFRLFFLLPLFLFIGNCLPSSLLPPTRISSLLVPLSLRPFFFLPSRPPQLKAIARETHHLYVKFLYK